MTAKKILIHGGTVVGELGAAPHDIIVEGETVLAIGRRGEFDSLSFDESIDATGLLVLPGLIDTHVHFDSPFMGSKTVHDFLSGTKSAAYGGITTVINFSTQAKGESVLGNLREQEKQAEDRSYIDWSMHGILLDATEESLSEIPKLVEEGVPTFKCFTTYRHSDRMMDDDGILRVLKATADSGGMLMFHCENDSILSYRLERELAQGHTDWIYHARTRPRSAENVAIQRVLDLMREEPAPIFIAHTSTKESARIIQDARSRGEPVHSETCTQYLVLTEEELKREDGHFFICSPPLRLREDVDALWTAARTGAVELVSSDDAGLPSEDRTRLAEGRFDKVPNGMPGIEPRLTMLYTEGVKKNRIPLSKLVTLTSANPSRLFGMFPRKGCLAPGSDADIVLFDPEVRWTMSAADLHMNTDFCPFEGREVFGKPKTVFCRGEAVVRDYELVGTPKHGRRVMRKLDDAYIL